MRIVIDQHEVGCWDLELSAKLECDFFNRVGNALTRVVRDLVTDDGNPAIAKEIAMHTADAVHPIRRFIGKKKGPHVILRRKVPGCEDPCQLIFSVGQHGLELVREGSNEARDVGIGRGGACRLRWHLAGGTEFLVEAVTILRHFIRSETFRLACARVELVVVLQAEIDEVFESGVGAVVIDVSDLTLAARSNAIDVVAEAAFALATGQDFGLDLL
jgi:hypothetical protein